MPPFSKRRSCSIQGALVRDTVVDVGSRYVMGETVDEGCFGRISKVKNLATRGGFAMKRVKKADARTVSSIERETKILKRLDHPCIVRLYETVSSENNESPVGIVLNLCEGGPITRRGYDEEEARVVLKQLVSGVAYLHSRNVCHRDLKAENVLLESDADGALDVQIIDFGLATTMTGRSHQNFVGTPYTSSPEMCSNKGYTLATDMWAVGVVAYQVLTGNKDVFGSDTLEELLRLKRAGSYVVDSEAYLALSDDAKDLIASCLRVDPETRITASAALDHAFFRDDASSSPSVSGLCSSMWSYGSYGPVKKASYVLLARSLPSRKMHALREAFLKHASADGDLDLESFSRLVSTSDPVGAAESDVTALFKTIRLGASSGGLSYSEFIGAALDAQVEVDDEKFKAVVFDRFGRDDDSNTIAVREVAAVLGKCNASSTSPLLKSVKTSVLTKMSNRLSLARRASSTGPRVSLSDFGRLLL